MPSRSRIIEQLLEGTGVHLHPTYPPPDEVAQLWRRLDETGFMDERALPILQRMRPPQRMEIVDARLIECHGVVRVDLAPSVELNVLVQALHLSHATSIALKHCREFLQAHGHDIPVDVTMTVTWNAVRPLESTTQLIRLVPDGDSDTHCPFHPDDSPP
jgi:hypothetical protein